MAGQRKIADLLKKWMMESGHTFSTSRMGYKHLLTKDRFGIDPVIDIADIEVAGNPTHSTAVIIVDDSVRS